MSELIRLFLTFLVILNPPAALLTWRSLSAELRPGERWPALAAALALAAAGLLAAALSGGEVIDALDVSLSSFQVGAGLLLILGVLRVFVTKDPWVAPPYRGNYQAAVAGLRLAVWLATPASLAAAAFYGADRGEADTALPLGLVLALSGAAIASGAWISSGTLPRGLREAGRLLAIVLIVLAIDLIFDGITRV